MLHNLMGFGRMRCGWRFGRNRNTLDCGDWSRRYVYSVAPGAIKHYQRWPTRHQLLRWWSIIYLHFAINLNFFQHRKPVVELKLHQAHDTFQMINVISDGGATCRTMFNWSRKKMSLVDLTGSVDATRANEMGHMETME